MKMQAIGNLSFGKMSEQKMKFSKWGEVEICNMSPLFGDRENRPENCSVGQRVKKKDDIEKILPYLMIWSCTLDSEGNFFLPLLIPLGDLWVAAMLLKCESELPFCACGRTMPTFCLLFVKQIFLSSHWHQTYLQKWIVNGNQIIYLFIN